MSRFDLSNKKYTSSEMEVIRPVAAGVFYNLVSTTDVPNFNNRTTDQFLSEYADLSLRAAQHFLEKLNDFESLRVDDFKNTGK